MKKLCSILIVLSMLFSLSTQCFAASNSTVDKNTNVSKEIQAKIDKILSVDNLNGIKGVDTKNSTDINNSLELSATPSIINTVTPVLIRSGNTTSVEVYLHYSGSDLANSISITSATIQNTSWLFPTTYGSFGSRSYMFDYPTTYTYVRIGSISIPTNVSTVYFYTTGLMIYSLTDGTFHSFTNISGSWPIS